MKKKSPAKPPLERIAAEAPEAPIPGVPPACVICGMPSIEMESTIFSIAMRIHPFCHDHIVAAYDEWRREQAREVVREMITAEFHSGKRVPAEEVKHE